MLPNSPPFELGSTLKGTDSDGNLINSHWLGHKYTFPMPNPSSDIRGNKSRPTNKTITAICLRNMLPGSGSGSALLGKRIARLTRTAGYSPIEQVDQYAISLAERGIVIVDSYLPSAGVAYKDLFWGIIEGPCTILTPTVDTDFNGAIGVGDLLVAATGATSGHTSYGRVAKAALASVTDATNAFAMARNTVATALSARTTGNTNSDLLVNANIIL